MGFGYKPLALLFLAAFIQQAHFAPSVSDSNQDNVGISGGEATALNQIKEKTAHIETLKKMKEDMFKTILTIFTDKAAKLKEELKGQDLDSADVQEKIKAAAEEKNQADQEVGTKVKLIDGRIKCLESEISQLQGKPPMSWAKGCSNVESLKAQIETLKKMKEDMFKTASSMFMAKKAKLDKELEGQNLDFASMKEKIKPMVEEKNQAEKEMMQKVNLIDNEIKALEMQIGHLQGKPQMLPAKSFSNVEEMKAYIETLKKMKEDMFKTASSMFKAKKAQLDKELEGQNLDFASLQEKIRPMVEEKNQAEREINQKANLIDGEIKALETQISQRQGTSQNLQARGIPNVDEMKAEIETLKKMKDDMFKLALKIFTDKADQLKKELKGQSLDSANAQEK
ncbi:unnamed protein product [Bemisia tabaci]|uniref:Uncharacterized protein n=1 Tax=Bemisia tabaci TaxID=7038 RepID=A0A9P0G382_BEMTA|nr:unnamed protein product [Bemisia tabaci]